MNNDITFDDSALVVFLILTPNYIATEEYPDQGS